MERPRRGAIIRALARSSAHPATVDHRRLSPTERDISTDPRPGQLYLGHELDSDGKAGAPLLLDARDLTTHAVIVGMTGSGKTGLGIVLLEEALLAGVPALILDPKGDMGNLLLNFPDFRPEEFRPWVNEGDAARAGLSPDDFAARAAQTWREGLEGAGVGAERMRRLRDGADFALYTPGSSAGLPMNILGNLRAPDSAGDLELMQDEVESLVSGLLGLVGVEADPLTSREHILLSNLVERSWSAGQDLDLPTIIAQVQQPPLRKLGVFELDSFFPEKDRLALALRLNGLLAAPSFANWISGPPLDIGALLKVEGGRPSASIVYLAHLSEEERQFTVALLLSKLVTWMRRQSGTTDLRALVYMDEVYGYAPPSANPPAKKPILTILKQARAFGLGMVLCTQNPVDLDYKALSNAGTWCIGRLQTERDQQRLMAGLGAASGATDLAALGGMIGNLAKRQFVLQSAAADRARRFSSRWAMSYLRGPLTRDQVQRLTAGDPRREAPGPRAATSTTTRAAAAPALAEDESQVAPEVHPSVPVRYLHPAADWAGEVGARAGGRRLQAALAARVHLRFDDAKSGVEQREEWEAVYTPLGRFFDGAGGIDVDYDDRDLAPEPHAGAVYILPEARLDGAAYFKEAPREIKDDLRRRRSMEVFACPPLKLYSRAGESREAFAARARAAAEAQADREAAALRDKLEARIDRIEDKVRADRAREGKMEEEVATRRSASLLTGAGSLLGAFLGGRGTAGKLSRVVRSVGGMQTRSATTARAGERLEGLRERVSDQESEIQALEQELARSILEIDERWSRSAEDITPIPIGLEASDVAVDELVLVWLPIDDGPSG